MYMVLLHYYNLLYQVYGKKYNKLRTVCQFNLIFNYFSYETYFRITIDI